MESLLFYDYYLESRKVTLHKSTLNMTLSEISQFGDPEEVLTLPDLPEEFLEVVFVDNKECFVEEITDSFPLAISDVTEGSITDVEKLSKGDGVKEVYSITLSTENSSFKPGDTIGIVTQNKEEDIRQLFSHLGISNLASNKCKIIEKTKKTSIKPFLNRITTLENVFTHHLDLQFIPKKVLIRLLAEYTKNKQERKELEELCCKEKPDLYTKQILESQKTFLDLLLKFPSCCPPAARLIENLPKLLPRAYSIASSPLSMQNKVRIVFSVVKHENGIIREGLCTGMLKSLLSKREKENAKVKMFFRKCNGFNLPESDVPLILIGPGTGVAPFIGFLEHRKMEGRSGKIWLFFGCRHKEKDFLFEKELENFSSCGVLTKLSVAFSRDGNEGIKYVQDNLRKHGKELCDWIFEQKAMIYVCGDARNMRKDIQAAFVEIFESNQGMTNKEATEVIKKLQKEKKYLQDIWL